MMEHQHIYEIPSQNSGRETVAVEMNNFSEADNEVVSPEVVYVRVKLKGKDYMCCSVFNIMFCNCLFLGFAALICSLKISEITACFFLEHVSLYSKLLNLTLDIVFFEKLLVRGAITFSPVAEGFLV
uniref:Uncharacterized protein n=1 Tax=Cyprinus carpio TaxID=7962 RepID=A0A8C2HQP0_CYPCA